MKKLIKNNLVFLPRKIRLFCGKVFMYMLGKLGTHEFKDDICLYNELRLWVETKGKPNTGQNDD